MLNQGRETYVKPAAFQAATILTDGGGYEEWRFLVEVVELQAHLGFRWKETKSPPGCHVLRSRDIASTGRQRGTMSLPIK
jgi:hypothetical protein